jgi:hypothetical protein
MIRSIGLVGLFVAFVLGSVGAAQAGTQVASPVPFGEGASVPEKVKAECGLETTLPTSIQESADVDLVSKVNQNAASALELAITEVHAPGGGAFSGPKWMEVQGKLYEKGKLVGTFRAKRFSTGVGFKGTCAIIGRCAQVMGRDIAEWLQAPAMNSKLGDAK